MLRSRDILAEAGAGLKIRLPAKAPPWMKQKENLIDTGILFVRSNIDQWRPGN